MISALASGLSGADLSLTRYITLTVPLSTQGNPRNTSSLFMLQKLEIHVSTDLMGHLACRQTYVVHLTVQFSSKTIVWLYQWTGTCN